MGGNDQNRAEKQNVVLTWFRPVTWSSGHLVRRFSSKNKENSLMSGVGKGCFFSKRVVLADVPPGTKTGTREHSDVPPERKPE